MSARSRAARAVRALSREEAARAPRLVGETSPCVTSSSTRSAPAATAAANACESSPAPSAAPRCATTSGRPSPRRRFTRRGATRRSRNRQRGRPRRNCDRPQERHPRRLRGPPGTLREDLVEAFDAEQLTAAPRLDHAVGVENDRAARLERRSDLLVLLRRIDSERETAALQRADAPVGCNQTRRRVAGTRAAEPRRRRR